MRSRLAILVAMVLAGGNIPLAAARDEPGGVQNQMREAMGGRSVLPLKQIEARVVPMMHGMQYLGPEYDPVAMAYRLKFIRSGHVVFVDVDGRSGRVIDEHR